MDGALSVPAGAIIRRIISDDKNFLPDRKHLAQIADNLDWLMLCAFTGWASGVAEAE